MLLVPALNKGPAAFPINILPLLVVIPVPLPLPIIILPPPVVSAVALPLPIIVLDPGFPDKPAGILTRYVDVPSINASESPFKLVAPPADAAIVISVALVCVNVMLVPSVKFTVESVPVSESNVRGTLVPAFVPALSVYC